MVIWYVHNLPESKNVLEELEQAAQTADSIIRREFPAASVDVSFDEIGQSRLEEEYQRTQAPILITDKFTFSIPGGFEIKGTGWSSYSTAISADQLRSLWRTHKSKIMSPNIRDYLGVVRKANNINNGIKGTATEQPENFAIFNNGITILVHDYQVNTDGATGTLSLQITGAGIVNGGQTTGALGELSDTQASKISSARVMARFVKCSDTEILGNIVRYNNTQNKVEASDFRSNDPIQHKLRTEFESIPDAEYRGGRRGSTSDVIARKTKSLVPDSAVAQSLAAFHGDPNLAYNDTRSIWDNDSTYTKVFRDNVTARHIVFTYGLFKSVENAKLSITKIAPSERTASQKEHAQFFSTRGANCLLVTAVSSCIETILGRAVTDNYSLIFKENISPVDAAGLWQPVVDMMLSFSKFLKDATDQGLKSRERVSKAIEQFSAMVEATRSMSPERFDNFSNLVIN